MQLSIQLTKRFIDLALGTLGAALAAPLMGLIAAGIKITSPGPAIYRQRRAGIIPGADDTLFNEFWLYKFRTMVPDAESTTGAVLAQDDDPRVTRLGRFLRATRLDELPQLYNVIVGQMSLVGPRPERPELMRNLALAIPYFEERMRTVKPGITGLAQVSLSYSGRLLDSSNLLALRDTLINPFELEGVEDSEADDMRTKMLYDFAYAASLESFWEFLRMDLRILVQTPMVMFWKTTGR